jgi:hypothetical protein
MHSSHLEVNWRLRISQARNQCEALTGISGLFFGPLNIPPKCQLTLNRLHEIVSLKIWIFIATAVRNSNPASPRLSTCNHLKTFERIFIKPGAADEEEDSCRFWSIVFQATYGNESIQK